MKYIGKVKLESRIRWVVFIYVYILIQDIQDKMNKDL